MKKLKKDYYQRNFYDEIHITDHAKKRFIQRSNKTIDGIYKGNVYRTIISMVKKSKLINSIKHKDNKMYEYRECSGYIFVCLITFSENFWENDTNEIIDRF